tara:strand:- start:661 stop:1026 length:366 start_codon:yes stop_codon:yes gene_type:complete
MAFKMRPTPYPYKGKKVIAHTEGDGVGENPVLSYKNKYGDDGLVVKDNPEVDLSEREDPYVTKALEAQDKVKRTLRGESVEPLSMKNSPLDKYASAAQRKARWANEADGGAGHPDKKKKKK